MEVNLLEVANQAHEKAKADLAFLESERKRLSLDALADPAAGKELMRVEKLIAESMRDIERAELAGKEADECAIAGRSQAKGEAIEQLEEILTGLAKRRDELFAQIAGSGEFRPKNCSRKLIRSAAKLTAWRTTFTQSRADRYFHGMSRTASAVTRGA